MTIDFMASAQIDDVVEVITKPAEVGGARIVLAQAVQSGDKVLIKAGVTVGLVNGAGRPRRLPSSVRQRLGGLIQNLTVR